MTLPNNDLQLHLKQSPKLVKYSERITKNYFKDEGYCSNGIYSQTNSTNSDKTDTGKDEEDSSSKHKRYIYSGIFAFIAMSTFAMYKGILSVSIFIFKESGLASGFNIYSSNYRLQDQMEDHKILLNTK